MLLAIDFGGTEIKLGLAAAGTADDESDVSLVATATCAVRGSAEDLAAAADLARDLIADAAQRIDAVAIAVPGVVDRGGRLLHANDKYDHIRDLDLGAWARGQFEVDTVVVENDARAALMGAAFSLTAASGGTRPRDVVLMTLGTGIGTAVLIDGAVLRGSHGHAGILGGHVTVDLHAKPCPCGNIGCAESIASAWALRHRTDVTAPDLQSLFETDDTADAALADAYIRVWGAVAVTLCHMYDPEVVLVSGGVLRAGERVRVPLERYLHAHLWPTSFRPPVVVPPDPQFSVVRGLSILANDALLAGDHAEPGLPTSRAPSPALSTEKESTMQSVKARNR